MLGLIWILWILHFLEVEGSFEVRFLICGCQRIKKKIHQDQIEYDRKCPERIPKIIQRIALESIKLTLHFQIIIFFKQIQINMISIFWLKKIAIQTCAIGAFDKIQNVRVLSINHVYDFLSQV